MLAFMTPAEVSNNFISLDRRSGRQVHEDRSLQLLVDQRLLDHIVECSALGAADPLARSSCMLCVMLAINAASFAA
jgi:hypothetical protein